MSLFTNNLLYHISSDFPGFLKSFQRLGLIAVADGCVYLTPMDPADRGLVNVADAVADGCVFYTMLTPMNPAFRTVFLTPMDQAEEGGLVTVADAISNGCVFLTMLTPMDPAFHTIFLTNGSS